MKEVWNGSLFGSERCRLPLTCGIRSSPTRSSSPKIPVFGIPNGFPMTVSAISTVSPASIASTTPSCSQ